ALPYQTLEAVYGSSVVSRRRKDVLFGQGRGGLDMVDEHAEDAILFLQPAVHDQDRLQVRHLPVALIDRRPQDDIDVAELVGERCQSSACSLKCQTASRRFGSRVSNAPANTRFCTWALVSPCRDCVVSRMRRQNSSSEVNGPLSCASASTSSALSPTPWT